MWGALAKLLMWLLGLCGLGKEESEAHRAERLTREAAEAKARAVKAEAEKKAIEEKERIEREIKEKVDDIGQKEDPANHPTIPPGGDIFG